MFLPDAQRRSALFGLSALLILASCRGGAPVAAANIPVPGGDFEDGGAAWDLSAAPGLARVESGAACTGAKGLHLESRADAGRGQVLSPRLPVAAGLAYRLTWQARVLAGGGTNVALRFLDGVGGELAREEGRVWTEGGNRWRAYSVQALPPSGAVAVQVVIQRSASRPADFTVDLDDFSLETRPLVVAPPWPGTYKLRPDERDRLTEADVVGPDGLVYPDFSRAGVPGGIPHPPVVVRLADLGARPGQDVSGLIEQAAAQAAAAGGGAIEIGAGDYVLDQPVLLTQDGVVLRGAGPERTRLLFRYRIPRGEVRFHRLTPGQDLAASGVIEFHANPRDLLALELRCGERRLERRVRQDHWGNTFLLRVNAGQALNLLGEGLHTFTAVAEYRDGRLVERTMDLRLVKTGTAPPVPVQLAAINLVGGGTTAGRLPILADVPRGGREVLLAEGHGLTVGDRLTLVAPASERWKAQVGSASSWATQAECHYQVTAVAGGRLTLHQPVRTVFSVVDGAYVQRIRSISGVGVEGLTLEQEEVPDQGPRGPVDPFTLSHPLDDLWTSGISTSFAWGCWIQDVAVVNTGRNAVYFPQSKHIEIRRCRFDGALFKGGGGTGYVGFERSWDCLMDEVEVTGMRHAPNNQWNSSGNVVRNSRFHGSDGQWHAGFTLENLYEGNVIDARGDGGSYGHGLYASGPTSGLHGPQGPRNVVYRNDIIARKDGLHMLGGNEGWLILHNRFVMDEGRAVVAKERSFDHIIAGNVFVLRRPQQPAIVLNVDATGIELRGNRFFGVAGPLVNFAGGITTLADDQDNRSQATVPTDLPAVPTPAVPSLFAWQREEAGKRRITGPPPP